MWWFFFILFFITSCVTTTMLYYSLRRINNYESFLLQLQRIIQFSSQKLKTIDDSGHFESDDEIGFFFDQVKNMQLLFDELFENQEQQNMENLNGKKEK